MCILHTLQRFVFLSKPGDINYHKWMHIPSFQHVECVSPFNRGGKPHEAKSNNETRFTLQQTFGIINAASMSHKASVININILTRLESLSITQLITLYGFRRCYTLSPSLKNDHPLIRFTTSLLCPFHTIQSIRYRGYDYSIQMYLYLKQRL